MSVEMEAVSFEVAHWPKPPLPVKRGLDRFYGSFKTAELSGGNVRILGDWMQDNIVTVGVRVRSPREKSKRIRKIQVHRKIAPMFEDLMAYIFEQFPGYPILQLGGFCPRHKMHNPERGLSVHSWGAAIDINWKNNPVSRRLKTDFPDGFVEVFEAAGWNWGGRWNGFKDAMHFQFTKGA